MAERQIEVLARDRHYFEGPRWHDGRWWASDVYGRRVLSWSEAGAPRVELELDDLPSGLGWLPDGSLLVVSMRRQQILRRAPDGSVGVHADLAGLIVAEANDIVVDPTGRSWVGAVGFDLVAGEAPRPSVVVRVEPDGAAAVGAGELMFPNGMVLSADGRTLVVGETFGARYTAFTIQPDGRLADRRVWAQLPQPFAPDGAALDADGCIWSADASGRRCVRLAEGGEVLEQIEPIEGLACFAVALGAQTAGRCACALLRASTRWPAPSAATRSFFAPPWTSEPLRGPAVAAGQEQRRGPKQDQKARTGLSPRKAASADAYNLGEAHEAPVGAHEPAVERQGEHGARCEGVPLHSSAGRHRKHERLGEELMDVAEELTDRLGVRGHPVDVQAIRPELFGAVDNEGGASMAFDLRESRGRLCTPRSRR